MSPFAAIALEANAGGGVAVHVSILEARSRILQPRASLPSPLVEDHFRMSHAKLRLLGTEIWLCDERRVWSGNGAAGRR